MCEENELDKDIDSMNDPFTKHLQYELSDELLVSMSNLQPNEKQVDKFLPVLGQLLISIPQPLENVLKKPKPKISILEEKTFAPTGSIPQIFNKVDFDQLFIKSQIKGNIIPSNKNNLIKRDMELSEVLTPLQKELFSIMNNYLDLYYPERSFTNADEIRYTYCLHVANHILKTRTKILHHNAKLSMKSEFTDEYRDQGLVRPKVGMPIVFEDYYKYLITLSFD